MLQTLKQQPTIIGAGHSSGFHQITPLEYRHYFVLPFCTCYCQIWSNFKKQSNISIICFLFIFSVIIAFKQIPGKYNIQDQVFKHSQLLFFWGFYFSVCINITVFFVSWIFLRFFLVSFLILILVTVTIAVTVTVRTITVRRRSVLF